MTDEDAVIAARLCEPAEQARLADARCAGDDADRRGVTRAFACAQQRLELLFAADEGARHPQRRLLLGDLGLLELGRNLARRGPLARIAGQEREAELIEIGGYFGEQ